MNFIPALLLALVLLCLCCFLGGGALLLLYPAGRPAAQKRPGGAPLQRAGEAQRPDGADALLTGGLVLTGLAVTAHLAAVFTGQSFSRCLKLFLGILAAALLLAAALWFFYLIKGCEGKKRRGGTIFRGTAWKKEGNGALFRKNARKRENNREGSNGENGSKKPDRAEKLLTGIFLALALAQLACVLWNAGVYTQGDMTVETVGSFLQTDSVYGVNPLTGQAYTAGIPSRLKILCLPALYGFFCRLSGLAPELVVTAAVPVWIFVSSCGAFFCVGKSLFPESRKKRLCFMITIVILLWAGGRLCGMDGFNLLYCGYRGVTVRNLVLLPYLVSLCLRGRWRQTILCVLAEACIVWTFYGMGACVLTAAGLFLAGRGRRDGRAS